MNKKRRLGAEYEEAVYRFVKILDPTAEVILDHSVPDRDTGEPRQCDVWINAKFGGHWPLSILVSCKDHKRKLHSGDIGTFRDEVYSTGASTGVIYSRAGFTKPALRKAKVNNFSCCRIYQNEPADIPGSLCFIQFACSPQIRLAMKPDLQNNNLKTWHDMFVLKQDERTILDVICAETENCEETTVMEAINTGLFPRDWEKEIHFVNNNDHRSISIQIFGRWKKYQARIEATLLEGSYCINDGLYWGKQAGPWINVRDEHLSEIWQELVDNAPPLPSNRVIFILYRGETKELLQEKFGPLPLWE